MRVIDREKVRDTEWASHEKPWLKYPEKAMLSSSEAHYIYDTAKRLGSGNCANLGVWRGFSTAAMAFGLRESNSTGIVYAVDHFLHPEPYPERMIMHLQNLGLDKYVKVCTGKTAEWGRKLEHIRFKFIFVDAGHAYDVVMEDIALWSPLLEDEGIIAFHDIHHNDVRRAIDDSLKGWHLFEKVWNIESYMRHEPKRL